MVDASNGDDCGSTVCCCQRLPAAAACTSGLTCGGRADAGAGVTPRRRASRCAPLFCDVVGSTSLAETMDPEGWAEIVNSTVCAMATCVERYGGTVARFAGDSILAVFGAPLAHEDDPYRAVHAGWKSSQWSVKPLPRERPSRFGRGSTPVWSSSAT
jgi:class 3 adenylate cyclase